MELVKAQPEPVDVLRALAACPTAPYHEAYVAARLVELCREFGLHVQSDPYGNLFVWTATGSSPFDPAAGRAATVVFSAHMDHPGFEVSRPLIGRLLGGTHVAAFQRRVPVRVFDGGEEVAGAITGHFSEGGATMLQLETERPVRAGAFGMWEVGPFRAEEGLLYLPDADDLAGCAAILCALARVAGADIGSRALGVFTRCEEVGLIGASLVCQQRLLPPEAIVVSLETSRELPGAEMGGGPVIRVGDRSSAFHHEGEALLRRAAARLQQALPATKVQRQLMSGGTCEATAYLLAGYRATGVALPLGNYHNNGPHGQIAPEFIHADDLRGATALLTATIEEAAQPTLTDDIATRLADRAQTEAERLRRTATWALLAAPAAPAAPTGD